MPFQRVHPPLGRLLPAAVLPAIVAVAAQLAWTTPAQAQREVPKIGNICPMGYVDMLNGRCSTLGLIKYTVRPTNGEACPSGWMNVGGEYCRQE